MAMNKPIAWMQTHYKDNKPTKFSLVKTWEEDIPLYTHPAEELKNIVLASATCSCGKVMEVTNLQPVKELTDEEILDLFDEYYDKADMLGFARAILRKAQEK